MCGIAAILNFHSKGNDPRLIRQMTNAMAHRGPDADGFYEDDHVSLGHRRLSIIDLSSAANQPFIDHTGRYVIIFNGEIYNYREIKNTITDYPFRTSSDTEVLVAAFSKWGASCIKLFKGMFTFAVWDKSEKVLSIFRDRLGVKPLYYYVNDSVFCFASEIRSILSTGLVKSKLNKDALPGYFSFQSFGFPNTVINDIHELEAGCYLQISEGKIQKTNYWKVAVSEKNVDFNDKQYVQKEIRHLLADAVERRLVSDVPVGAFLSGGIDSSVVVGLMAEVSNSKPVTFNISFSEKEFDEAPYADIIAKKFNTDHHTIRLKPDNFLAEIDNALLAMDTPSGDGINTYVVSKAIRNAGITVALSGVGGDELFGGYPFFRQYLELQKRKALFSATKPLRQLGGNIFEKLSTGKNNRVAQLLAATDLSIEHTYPVFRQILSPGLMNKLINIPGHNPIATLQQLNNRSEELSHYPLLSQVSVAEYLGYTQHTLLKDTDQMSMAVSLEVREPFFDHELIEFVLAIPDKIKYPVYPKSLLVESVAPLLPDEVVHRKKQGFLFPWNLWMKNELKSFCESMLKSIAERDFIHGKNLLGYWKRFLSNDPSVRWAEIWLFVVLEFWMQKNQVEE